MTDVSDLGAALDAWRTQQVRQGAAESELPTTKQMKQIEGLPEITRESLLRMPARQRQMPVEVADSIVAHLRASSSAAGAAPDGPGGGYFPPEAQGQPPRPDAGAQTLPDDGLVDPAGFAPLDLTSGLSAEPAPQQVSAKVTLEGVQLSWSRRDGTTVVYRVVTDDGGRKPYSPESGIGVGATSSAHITDSRPMTESVRWVQVWAHEGADLASAKATQPRLHAAGAVIAPVADVQLKESQGIVSASWRTAAGTERVAVLRIPASEAGVPGFAPRYQLPDVQGNLGGFVDDDAVSGAEYEYRLFAMASVDGSLMASPPSVHRVAVSAPVQPVLDLAVEKRPDRADVVDLSWTQPPHGEVRLYRTETAPEAGLEAENLSLDALSLAGLTEQARLTFPIMSFDGRAIVAGVPWPAETNRAYFTPVTFREGVARVGRTSVLTRTAPLVGPRLVQRVSYQLLTFGWPADAAEVRVYITGRGMPLPPRLDQPLARVTEDEYVSRGGMRLAPGVLPAAGCDVHLVPVSWDAGAPVPGEPAKLTYGGLIRLRYRLQSAGGSILGGFTRGLGKRTLEIQADMTAKLPVVVVVNRDRLPLHARDGEMVLRQNVHVSPGEWQIVTEFSLERGQRGFLRLFADVPLDVPVDIAVLDPPLPTLQR